MLNNRRGPIPSELDWLIDTLDGYEERLRTLEAPSGENLSATVAKLQGLVKPVTIYRRESGADHGGSVGGRRLVDAGPRRIHARARPRDRLGDAPLERSRGRLDALHVRRDRRRVGRHVLQPVGKRRRSEVRRRTSDERRRRRRTRARIVGQRSCGNAIEDRGGHWIAGGRLFCAGCAAGTEAHRVAFPGCRVEVHDATDHEGSILATRAGAIWTLAQ